MYVVGVWQSDIWTRGVCLVRRTRHTHHGSTYHAAKHRPRTQNITSDFSQARLILLEDGSQRIRNMSEFLFVF